MSDPLVLVPAETALVVIDLQRGILKMPVQKFLFYCWIGKTLKMLAFAFAGAYAVHWLTP